MERHGKRKNRIVRLTVRRIQRLCEKSSRFSKTTEKAAIKIGKTVVKNAKSPDLDFSMLTAICSLWIANKFHDVYYVPAGELMSFAKRYVPDSMMRTAETQILKSINYDLLNI